MSKRAIYISLRLISTPVRDTALTMLIQIIHSLTDIYTDRNIRKCNKEIENRYTIFLDIHEYSQECSCTDMWTRLNILLLKV